MNVRPWITGLSAITVIGTLVAIVVPHYIRARTAASVNTCIDRNLPAIASAKKRWAEATGPATGVTPERADLLKYLEGGRWPVCPLGGTYDAGPKGSPPRCSLTNEHPWKAIRTEVP